jgi:hypothetical protein
MSTRLGPKVAEAVLSIVEGDALDEARQGASGMGHRPRFINHRPPGVLMPAA